MPSNLLYLLVDPAPEPFAVGIRQRCRARRGWWDSCSEQQQARAQLPKIIGTHFSTASFPSVIYIWAVPCMQSFLEPYATQKSALKKKIMVLNKAPHTPDFRGKGDVELSLHTEILLLWNFSSPVFSFNFRIKTIPETRGFNALSRLIPVKTNELGTLVLLWFLPYLYFSLSFSFPLQKIIHLLCFSLSFFF